jgi:TatD DNase family protein
MPAGQGIISAVWIDTHCHLDAPGLGERADAVVAAARAVGVGMQVIPAGAVAHFEAVRELAHRYGLAYALGIHPLWVSQAADDDLERVREALALHRGDPRLVAVGEIGLDFFVPGLSRERQQHFYRSQLKLARDAGLPVILHVRRSADALLHGVREIAVSGGIAHAFNGSLQQAMQFAEKGFALGFGGALTFGRALQLRRLAAQLPAAVPVLETDAPDIPPLWLYRTAEQRAAGQAQGINEPAQLPRIAELVAQLRGISLPELAALNRANACRVLPKLGPLLGSA